MNLLLKGQNPEKSPSIGLHTGINGLIAHSAYGIPIIFNPRLIHIKHGTTNHRRDSLIRSGHADISAHLMRDARADEFISVDAISCN